MSLEVSRRWIRPRRVAMLAIPLVLAAICLPLEAKPKRAKKPAPAPENLARKAKATASSQFSRPHGGHLIADGKIAPPISQADLGKSWAAKGNNHPNGVWLTLEWPAAVTVAQIVYYGRSGWVWNENWKDYEVYLDDAAKPAVKGTFKPGHGPQRVKLAKPVQVKQIRLKLLNHYGGPNPGAAEVQVYAVSPPDDALGKFIKPSPIRGGGPGAPPPPPIEESPELAAKFKAGGLGFTKMLVVQRHHIRCTHVYTYHCEGQRDGGGLCIYDVTDGSVKRLLDTPKGQILGCDLSYDGRTILFSWRKTAEGRHYQLYRINVDPGAPGGLKRLTKGTHHNYDGCWLPDGSIVFLSSRVPQAAYCFFTPVGILYRMNPDGSDQRAISANYLNDFTPAVLNDGRIIYGRWEYVDRPAIPIQSLWTINPDGTMLQGFYGNRVLDPATFIEPRPIPGTDAILCTLTGHNGSCRGAIGMIDPAYGNNAQESIRNLTPEVRLHGIHVSSNGPRGPYQTPYPVDETYFMVSHDGTILLRDYDRTQQIVALKPDGIGFYNPQPLRSRTRPPVRTSLLEGLPQSTEAWASVYLQDVYNGLEPTVKRGEVKQIAVVEELARALIDSPGVRNPAFQFQRILVSCGATYVPKKVLGYADVDADGSAYFKVPAQTPIYFMALDAEGRAVQRMRSFTHLMPGEVQGCIGCHESRSQRPKHSAQPMALPGKPADLKPPEWGVTGFNYAAIVQPVLDRHCIKCHNAKNTPKGIDLTGDWTDYFNVSYEHLARKNQGREGSPYVKWIPTYNGHEANIFKIAPKTWGAPASMLARHVRSGHPDADGKPRVRLPDLDLRRLYAWMDLNVTYYPTADTAHPTLKACRRLWPRELAGVMNGVYKKRCASCHDKKTRLRQKLWLSRGAIHDMGLRVTNPHLNDFLLAPLAKGAGGTQKCGRPVFADTTDPDYQAVLKTFEPIQKLIKAHPRMDMPGAKPAPVCSAGLGT